MPSLPGLFRNETPPTDNKWLWKEARLRRTPFANHPGTTSNSNPPIPMPTSHVLTSNHLNSDLTYDDSGPPIKALS